MKKSETEDSNDDVFYSLSSAVSVTASDITRTPSPSPTTSQTVVGNVSSSAESKPSKLSRLKAFRPRKLIPKRFKTPPEVSLLPSDSDTPEKLSGKKESKIPKRTKASQLVRRLTFKKGQKVAPKGVDPDEDTSTTSSSTTPMSAKRETPEGAILSISEQSLCVVEERSVEESSADQSERKSSSASNQSSTKQELKITISGKKIEKLKRFYETSDDTKDTRSFEQLKYDVSAIARDTNTASLSSSDKTSLSAVTKTKKNRKSTIAPVLLPSPPPSPLMSIHIPLKLDTPKPISTISTKRDQVPSITAVAAATSRLASNENKNIVTDRDEQSSRQQQSLSEATKKSDTKKESLKSKLINKLNISRSVHDITPAVVAPVVPYEISDQEISSIVTSHALTPEEYTEFIKQDRDKSLSEQTTEKIFTLSEPNEASMKRSENTGSSETQNKHSTKIGKKRSKKTTQESSDSGLSTSVHVQEPQQPYQKQLSTSKSHDLNDPELTLNPTGTGEDEVTINKTGEISFRIGTPVRPPTNITHITESISLDSTENTKSLEEISSISSESQSPPTSESSRKKIKYLPQPTIYSSEEQALLEGNFGPPSSFVGSEYSIDYSLNPLSMVESAPEGAASGTQQVGVTNLTMSSEKREHLYKILVIGELGTGKTSFIKRYVHQFFSQNYRATIGVDFALKVLNWDSNTIIRLQLWDIAGQERFGNMTRVYYKEAVGAFIVFDVTRTSTFDSVIKWKQDLDSKVQLPDGSSIPCILLANKCDQPKQGIVTTPAKLDEYCKENGFSGWFETSAKENINIDDAAKALVNKILANDKVMNSNEAEMDGFAIDGRDNGTSKKNCAC